MKIKETTVESLEMLGEVHRIQVQILPLNGCKVIEELRAQFQWAYWCFTFSFLKVFFKTEILLNDTFGN